MPPSSRAAAALPASTSFASTALAAPPGGAHLLFVNKLLRHTPRSSAVIRFASGERIVITIAPSGIVIAKLWLRILHRPLVEWPRSDPKRLDRALVFFMSGPASDLPGDSVLDFFAGSGTLGAVAQALGRRYVLIDSNPEAVAIMRKRLGAPRAASA